MLFAAESAGRREILLDLLRGRDIEVTLFEDWRAFVDSTAPARPHGLLFSGRAAPRHPATGADHRRADLRRARAQQARRRRRAERDPATLLRELTDLRLGAPVVHDDYGVGRYQGLVTMEIAGQRGEFLLLEYADGDKLCVPVHALDRVNRYTGGAPETAPLHKLGTDQWAKARRKRGAADQGRRSRTTRPLFAPCRTSGRQPQGQRGGIPRLRCGLPVRGNPDQQQTIEQVLADLESERPMDRVVCGDVGFGKTEVALRAAFVAVQAGRQVAVLVPTTLLAQQHQQTFSDRFADWPVRIQMLSRFRSGRETVETVAALAAGQVDIVIATHRLLHANARFKNLGLVIVDEEHRFGVRDKESA